MARRLSLLVVTALAAAGSVATAGNDPWDPKERYNAADQARARAIKIRRSDLGRGDWRVGRVADDDQAIGACKNPDLSDLVLTGKAEHPNFAREGSLVGSEGEVWATAADAETSWRRSMRFPWKTCLPAAMRHGLGSDAQVTILSNGPVPLGKLAPRTFSHRLRFQIKGPRGTIQGRLSVYAFSHGRVDGSLMVISFGKPFQPVSPALERRLAGLVAKRVNG